MICGPSGGRTRRFPGGPGNKISSPADFSEFPPETSKATPAGLQPQTTFV